MRFKTICALLILVALVCFGAKPGAAALVTSLPGGTVIPMPVVNYFGPGPQAFGPGVTWSSTNATNQGGSVFGYTQGYGFLGNGYWDGGLVMAGVNDSTDVYGVTDTMTFAFSTPVSGVGGFLNYVPGSANPTTIAVYNAANTLIESYNLTFLTGGGTDTGAFYGFLESTADIKYFTLTDNYVGIANLTTSAVPLPGALLLFGPGLLGLAAVRRRLKK